MKVYHVTSFAVADAINDGGFCDATGRYLTDSEHAGVWISDSPLTENEGVALPDVVFEIDIEEAEIRSYEWIEEGKPYREWLVPAAVLNGATRRRCERSTESVNSSRPRRIFPLNTS